MIGRTSKITGNCPMSDCQYKLCISLGFLVWQDSLILYLVRLSEPWPSSLSSYQLTTCSIVSRRHVCSYPPTGYLSLKELTSQRKLEPSRPRLLSQGPVQCEKKIKYVTHFMPACKSLSVTIPKKHITHYVADHSAGI